MKGEESRAYFSFVVEILSTQLPNILPWSGRLDSSQWKAHQSVVPHVVRLKSLLLEYDVPATLNFGPLLAEASWQVLAEVYLLDITDKMD